MVNFFLNGQKVQYNGSPDSGLLDYLRLEKKITSVKDGCSGQGVCGACTAEINGKPRLACTTKMGKLEDATVTTMEGIPEQIRNLIVGKFSEKGAVQCGYCSPGMIIRVAHIFREKTILSRDEIFKAISPNLCRCTGYIKIVDAIETALTEKQENKIPTANIGEAFPKYQSIETALGKRPFVNDIQLEGLLHASLKFSDYPRAKIKRISTQEAESIEGVERIITATDIPGEKNTGLIFKDWPLMISTEETTNFIGDVLAVVVAKTEAIAREAVNLIKIDYEVYEAVTDMHDAILKNAP